MKQFFLIPLMLTCLIAGFAQNRTTVTSDVALGGATVSIRFHDRRIYFPGNSPTEPIMIRVSITNNTPRTIRFKLAEQHFFSLDFAGWKPNNTRLEYTDQYRRRRSDRSNVFFRELSIESGEEHSFTVNLKDYLHIDKPGIYIIEGYFYPELKRLNDASEPHVITNRLTLEVKPSPGPAASRFLPVSPVTAEPLQPQRIPPDEVISYMVTARQQSKWDQYFLYMDLRTMLLRHPGLNQRFRLENEQGQFRMIEEYKHSLSQSRIDRDIVAIPRTFEIEETSYSRTKGTVQVKKWFAYQNFEEIKRFTYYLEQRDGIWRVVDYTVDNIGTTGTP